MQAIPNVLRVFLMIRIITYIHLKGVIVTTNAGKINTNTRNLNATLLNEYILVFQTNTSGATYTIYLGVTISAKNNLTPVSTKSKCTMAMTALSINIDFKIKVSLASVVILVVTQHFARETMIIMTMILIANILNIVWEDKQDQQYVYHNHKQKTIKNKTNIPDNNIYNYGIKKIILSYDYSAFTCTYMWYSSNTVGTLVLFGEQ